VDVHRGTTPPVITEKRRTRRPPWGSVLVGSTQYLVTSPVFSTIQTVAGWAQANQQNPTLPDRIDIISQSLTHIEVPLNPCGCAPMRLWRRRWVQAGSPLAQRLPIPTQYPIALDR
jgi:hypothetical protein